MKRFYTLFIFAMLAVWVAASRFGDDELPTASPKMEVEDETGLVSTAEFSGSAPLQVFFSANPENLGLFTPLYEWHVYKDGNTQSSYLFRDVESFDFSFRESGAYTITLQISFVNGQDTIEYSAPTDFKIEVSTSVLNVPNAFSPNGDGYNDIFRVKQDYKSIVSFHGYIFNRFGKKLFEWSDLTEGWDGTYNGSDVADGAYFVKIEARGADGRHYNIKKAINLLRGYTENSAAGTN